MKTVIEIGSYIVYKTPYGHLTHSNINDPHVRYAREHGTLLTCISSKPATCKNKYCMKKQNKITGFEFTSDRVVGMEIKTDNE